MEQLPKANSSNYPTGNIKRACVIRRLFVHWDTTSKDNRRIKESHSIRMKIHLPFRRHDQQSKKATSEIKNQYQGHMRNSHSIIHNLMPYKELDETRKRNSIGWSVWKMGEGPFWSGLEVRLFAWLILPPSFWTEFPAVTQADLTLSMILRVDPELRILPPPPLDYWNDRNAALFTVSAVLGVDSRTLFVQGKHSTCAATAPAPMGWITIFLNGQAVWLDIPLKKTFKGWQTHDKLLNIFFC